MWGLSSCNVEVCHVHFVLVARLAVGKQTFTRSIKFASLIVTVSQTLPRRRKRLGEEALPQRSRRNEPPTRGNARLACTRSSVPKFHLVGDLVADNDRFCQSPRVVFVIPIPGCYSRPLLLSRSLIKVSTSWRNMEKSGNSSRILLEFFF